MAEVISAGPASFATEGERQAAALLGQQLPAGWIVICNKVLSTSDDRSFEIDFIVIATRWIFLLDEKSWKGRIRGDDEQWIREDGSSERSPLAKMDYVAKIFAGRLGYRLPPLKQGEHYVRGGVLLSAQKAYPAIYDPRVKNGIFLLTDVCQRLQKLDSQEGNPAVGQLSAKIKEELLHLASRPLVPAKIYSFNIEDAISLRPNVRLFYATLEGEKAEARHLLVYDLGRDPLQAEKLKEFYKQEYRAIKKLRSTGLVAEVQDPQIWSDDYLVVAMIPPDGKSLKALPLPETREEFAQELQLAAACFKGLEQIHAHGIIHRALGPEAIYVQMQGKQPPKVVFTNFYAARTGTGTISPLLDALVVDDPYASPSVAISYEYATSQADTFSLALILLERLAGISVTKIRPHVEDELLFPEHPRWSSFLPPELADELAQVFKSMLQPASQIQPLSAGEAATRLSELAGRLRTGDRGEEGRLLCGRYRVQRVLGQGMMARTYLVSDTAYAELGLFVLKQFLRSDEASDQALAEYKALKDITSKYLPRVEYIFAPEDDAHVLMRYIPGPTLQRVESEFPWPLERWWAFARDLLNAVEVLEDKGLLHRDIKPANIILHEDDNHPVLIDFGFAILLGDDEHVAGTPLYLPPEAATAAQTPPSTDRYAAAIVLFQALTGVLPFTIGQGGKRTIVDLERFEDRKVRRIAAILQRAVSNEPKERPATAAQLRAELQVAVQTVEVPVLAQPASDNLVNSWVDDIRSLYRNSGTGNTDNRGLDSDFVRQTYVPTALDLELLPLLFEQMPRVVFLSGNPGDGKTAFLEQVYLELKRRQATEVKYDASGWEMLYRGHIFRSCYDASEAHEHLSADEQLGEKLRGLEGERPSQANLTVLVAVNDGRLFDFFERKRTHYPWLAQQIDLLAGSDEIEQQDVWLVDLKKRAFVTLPGADPSIFRRVLEQFVAADRWSVCEGCAAKMLCPLRNNAQRLRSKKVAARLEVLFLFTHLRRQRHITMRDLRSALAYIITGNRNCQDIHEMRAGQEAGITLVNFSYWQNAFAPADAVDEVLSDIARLDPARFARPHLDRFLHFHQGSEDAALRRLLFMDRQDLPRERFDSEQDWMAAVKRRLYFEAPKAALDGETSMPAADWRHLLPYRYALKFVKLLDERIDPQVVLEQLALGLLRSDGVFEDVPAGKLGIKVSASDEQQLVVLKQFSLEDFELIVSFPQHTRLIETLPEIVVLQHKSGNPRLELTLDLFELLMQMADGLHPNAREYAPLLEDLKPFKDALLLHETQELVLIESQFRVHQLIQNNGKIVRQIV
ncbi:MAG: NERD domain-containing protein [Ktedonobacteraceae bacterium]|nr:NERD domain-containing protein [Ktedonobacteraceae bacterium]